MCDELEKEGETPLYSTLLYTTQLFFTSLHNIWFYFIVHHATLL